jgi:hypothetical protein
MHQEVAAFGGTDQAAGRGLPFRKILFGLRKPDNEIACVQQRDELAPAGQFYRIIEGAGPMSHQAHDGPTSAAR